MNILEREFTDISRAKARGALRLSPGTLEVYLFIARVGVAAGRFRDLEIALRHFNRQGYSRYFLGKAVAELTAAGLLRRVPGGGSSASRYTLPRLANAPAAADGARRADEAPAEGVEAAAARAAGGVSPEEAVETLAAASVTLRGLSQRQNTRSVQQALAAQLPRMGATRAGILQRLRDIGAAVEQSDYLRGNVSLGWLARGRNWEKVASGMYQNFQRSARAAPRANDVRFGDRSFEEWVEASKRDMQSSYFGTYFREDDDGVRRNRFGQTVEEHREFMRKRSEEISRNARIVSEQWKRRLEASRIAREARDAAIAAAAC